MRRRPLARDVGSLRDDRLFIIACDDTYAPKQYFGFFRLQRVQVHVVPAENGLSAASHILERLLQFDHEEDDERWLVLDVDHALQGTHIPAFMQTLTRARQVGVRVALSRPCFELWLLLHHMSQIDTDGLSTADEVIAQLRSTLGSYNKTRLQAEHFPLRLVADAIPRAMALDEPPYAGDVPAGVGTHVYRLWLAIIDSIHPTQFPEELRTVVRSINNSAS